jgi:hypothetical protein
MAISNGTIYLGGDFTRVGPPTGAFAAIDKTSGIVQEPYAGVLGGFNQVNAVASDGHGGWYIGGNFSTVQGEPRRCLAQIDANGRITSWNPRADFGVNAVVRVHAIAVHGDTVYVANDKLPSLLLHNRQDGTFDMTIPKRPIRKRLRGLPAFTTIRGGAYFFLPGIRALRFLASHTEHVS